MIFVNKQQNRSTIFFFFDGDFLLLGLLLILFFLSVVLFDVALAISQFKDFSKVGMAVGLRIIK